MSWSRVLLLGGVTALGLACGDSSREEDEETGARASEAQVRASAEVRDAQGNVVGTVDFVQGPNGTLVQGRLTGLPSGTHGFHVHDVGRCEAPGFESAGGHYNPDQRAHGFLSPEGPHAGDLPNLRAGDDGSVSFELFAPFLMDLGKALEGDGVAVVVHAHTDDYVTDPTGDAGPRLACGVLERTE